MTTTPQASAQDTLTAILADEADPYDVAKDLGGDGSHFTLASDRIYSVLRSLVEARNELAKEMSEAERRFVGARAFITGKPGRFESRGILGDLGSRIDVLSVTFSLRVEQATSILRDAYAEV